MTFMAVILLFIFFVLREHLIDKRLLSVIEVLLFSGREIFLMGFRENTAGTLGFEFGV